MRALSRVHQSNRSNIHLLRDRRVLAALVASADLAPNDLVVEFGAGTGIVTAELARTGANVVAIERDTRFAAKLERRLGDVAAVTIVAADARDAMLPRRPFAVVANIPYAISTPILRRLLGARDTSLRRADLLVQWGLAKRITTRVPRDFETAWWQVRFEISIARKVPPLAFEPPPRVDSAHLVIRRRPGLTKADQRLAWDTLRARYTVPARQARRFARHD